MAFDYLSTISSEIISKIDFFAIKPIEGIMGGVMVLTIPFFLIWAYYKTLLILGGFTSEPFSEFMRDSLIKFAIFAFIAVNGYLSLLNEGDLPHLSENMAVGIAKQKADTIIKEIEKKTGYWLDEIGKEEVGIGEAMRNEYDTACKEAHQKFKEETQNNDFVSDSDAQAIYTSAGCNGWEYAQSYAVSALEKSKQIFQALTFQKEFWEPVFLVVKLILMILGLFYLGISVFMVVFVNLLFFLLCLGVAPLFIFFSAFEKTRGWFNSWLNTTLGYCFVYPVVMIVVTGLFTIFDTSYLSATSEVSKEITWRTALTVLFLCYIFSLIIQQIGGFASGLFNGGNVSGGASSSAIGKASAISTGLGMWLGRTAYKNTIGRMSIGKKTGGNSGGNPKNNNAGFENGGI